MFHFRRKTLFCLGYRLSKHYVFLKFGGHGPWLRLCTQPKKTYRAQANVVTRIAYNSQEVILLSLSGIFGLFVLRTGENVGVVASVSWSPGNKEIFHHVFFIKSFKSLNYINPKA